MLVFANICFLSFFMFTFKKSLIKEDLATVDIRIDGDTRNPKTNPNKEIPREQL